MLKLVQIGRIDIPNAGTRVQLNAGSIGCPSIILTAAHGNTGNIYIGDSTVSSTAYAAVLSAGQSLTLTGITRGGSNEDMQINTLYADTATNGNDVHVSYYARA
jgi:hypothetical protein